MPWDREKGRWVEQTVADPIGTIPATRCRRCPAIIKFVPVRFTNSRSASHPIDAEPDPIGDIYQTESGLCRVARGKELKRVLAEKYGVEFYRSHFETCPAAGSFRRSAL